MTNEDRKNHYMNRNIKVIPSYIALTWDVLFVWTISTMFLTNQKGFSYAQAISLNSFQTLFACGLCLLVPKLLKRFSALKTSRWATIGYAGYILLYIFGKSYFTFIFAQLLLSIAYAIRAVKENSILVDTLRLVKRDKDYQRVYGNGVSVYYVLDAIGAIVITYVYAWNPYATYWLSLIFVCVAYACSFLLKDPNKFQESNIQISGTVQGETQSSKDKPSYKRVFKNAFFISMLVYIFFFRGILSIDGSMFRMYLQNLIDAKIIPLWAYGYIYAGVKVCVMFSSKQQFKYSLKFGVRGILIFNVLIILTLITNGLAFIIGGNSIVSIVIIIISSYLLCSLRIPNQIFMNNYMQVCMHRKDLELGFSIRFMVEYLGYSLLSFTCSALLTLFNENYGVVMLVYIGIFGIPLLISMSFFVRQLIKKHAQKYTIIKDEYTKD